MAIEQQLIQRLLNDSQLREVLGDRVFFGNIPQKFTVPAMVLTRRIGGHATELSGSAGFARPSFRLEVLSERYQETVSVTERLRQLFQAKTKEQWGPYRVSVVFDGDEDAQPLEPQNGSDQFCYRRLVYLWIWHTEDPCC